MYALLSGDGRDLIHRQIESLQLKWDELFTKITVVQRQLEVSVVEWTSYTDSVSQVEAWLTRMRMMVIAELPVLDTLHEKKTQLQTFKVAFMTCLLNVFVDLLLYCHRRPVAPFS